MKKESKASIKPKEPAKEPPAPEPSVNLNLDNRIMVGDFNHMSDDEINFFMTWFPKREDYEDKPEIKADESFPDKLQRLFDTIDSAQASIKEVVDTDNVTLECKIYRVMDLRQDMNDITDLQKQLDVAPEAKDHQEDLKKARIGLKNLQAYVGQVDCVEFASSIRNEFLFKVGSKEGFGPWLSGVEERVKNEKIENRPKNFDECMKYEEAACMFLKEVVKGNKMLKRVQEAAEGIKGNIEVQDEFSQLSERYYVLCKKADAKVKNIQVLLRAWQELDKILEPKNPFDMDDLQVKYFVSFLKTYASYFS